MQAASETLVNANIQTGTAKPDSGNDREIVVLTRLKMSK
jgi:hypothetical protein